jgi:hypothetical protein
MKKTLSFNTTDFALVVSPLGHAFGPMMKKLNAACLKRLEDFASTLVYDSLQDKVIVSERFFSRHSTGRESHNIIFIRGVSNRPTRAHVRVRRELSNC